MTRVRCAVIATPSAGGRAWAEQVRRWEDQGWDTLLVPDTVWTVSPFPALSAAAAVTTSLRLRPGLAAPLRTEGATAREAQAVQDLSGGRFELGIGTGRPDAAHDARVVGTPWPAPAERRAHLERVVRHVRAAVSPRPKVAMTVAGPRMARLAVELLAADDATADDRIALTLPPTADTTHLADRVRRLRARSDGTAGDGPGARHRRPGAGDAHPDGRRHRAGPRGAPRRRPAAGRPGGDGRRPRRMPSASASNRGRRAWRPRRRIHPGAVPAQVLTVTLTERGGSPAG